jgi:hypothetical protein
VRLQTPVPITPDPPPNEPQALKRIIAVMARNSLAAQAQIARLKFHAAQYQRADARRSYFSVS